MGYSAFKLNGKAIKNPTTFKIERYNVTTMERLANANMVGDLVAKKLKFYFTYEVLSAYDLDNILDIIWETNELFFTLSYSENGVAKTATVYSGAIPTDLHSAKSSSWVWKNVAFDLIQQ